MDEGGKVGMTNDDKEKRNKQRGGQKMETD
jgi:hypothetical protein